MHSILGSKLFVQGVGSRPADHGLDRGHSTRSSSHEGASSQCWDSTEKHHVSTNKNYRGGQVKATLRPKVDKCEDQEPFRLPAAILGAAAGRGTGVQGGPADLNHLDQTCFRASPFCHSLTSVEARAAPPAIGLHRPFHPRGRPEIREMRLAGDTIWHAGFRGWLQS